MENKSNVVMKKPGFWRVAAAYGIDLFFFIGGLWGLLLFYEIIGLMHVISNLPLYAQSIIFIGLVSLVAALCCAVLESQKTTVGKLMMGIRVTPNSFGRLFGAYMLDMILLFVGAEIFTNIVIACINLLPWTFNKVTTWIYDVLYLFGSIILMYIIVFIVIEGLSGASLGKWCFKIRVNRKTK